MWENLANALFAPSALTPHGFCLLWEPWLVWSQAAANATIAAAYFVIPVLLLDLVRRRSDLVLKPVFRLFSLFILLCGAGHLIDLMTIWIAAYSLAAIVNLATALVSVATALALWRLLPFALALPSRQQLEEASSALRESEERYRRGFRHAPMPLMLIDFDANIRDVSNRSAELLGYPGEALIGRKLTEFQPHPYADKDDQQARLRATGLLTDVPRSYLRRDGTLVDVLLSCHLDRQPGDATPFVVVSLVDVTARKRAEAALQRLNAELEDRVRAEVAAREEAQSRASHAERLQALGQLAGGIAHDFNNVLQFIQDSAALIEDRPEDVETVRDYAQVISGATDRAAAVVRRLLAFARRADLRAEPVDTQELVRSLYDMLRYTIGPHLYLHLNAEPKLPLLYADRGQLEIVLINLATNARDAMPNGGSLTITATTDTIGADLPNGLARGRYVRLAVNDTGGGMDAETLARAGEPFFTTKPLGQGTGLGLSMAKGFAEQSGGALDIRSAPGRGTTVTFWLPQHAPAADMPTAEIPAADIPAAKIPTAKIPTAEIPAADVAAAPETETAMARRPVPNPIDQRDDTRPRVATDARGPDAPDARVLADQAPAAPTPVGASSPSEAEAAAAPDTVPVVLLVDDEPVVRKVLGEQLKRAGYAVITAGCGDDALAVLDTGERVTLLVSDLSMPGMNGVALLQQAKRRVPGLPAILLTGYAGDESELVGRDLGDADQFTLLRKPVSGKVLLARIASLLAARGMAAPARPASAPMESLRAPT